MITIGMTGPIGHGKTTFANALEQFAGKTAHFESSGVISEVADALHARLQTALDPEDINGINTWLASLPQILADTVHAGVSFDQLKLSSEALQERPEQYQKLFLHIENIANNPELARQQITDENKESYRPILQWLGGYLVANADPGIWYNEIVRRVRDEASKQTELCVVGGLRYPTDARILREAGAKIIKVYRPGLGQSDIKDPTERERDRIPVDATIINNGTIEDLSHCAQRFLTDLRLGNLAVTYSAVEAGVTS